MSTDRPILSTEWERQLARRIAEDLHLLINGVFASPSDYIQRAKRTCEWLDVEYGGVLSGDDAIAIPEEQPA